ncbi:MAG TPA: hypothetical protein VKA55_08940 [Gammaproteobacteria bacterium]|nr:hypothetical protein [Gammaproteobacteria bacterium]
MWNTAALEWNALLNRARSALLEQENLLAVLEHPHRPSVSGHLPDRRQAIADWGATRRRFLHAFYGLSELANRPSATQPVELRMMVTRLEVTAGHLQQRYHDAASGRGAGSGRWWGRLRPRSGPEGPAPGL